jgi:hypothetical protein
MSDDIAEAKRRLPLPALLHRLGMGEHAKKSARCPFHEDKHNSFSIWQGDGVWFFKCHAGCREGDEIIFLELHRKISRSDATKLYLEMAGVNCSSERPRCASPQVRQRVFGAAEGRESGQSFDWQKCLEAFTDKHLERLAQWRGYSIELCRWLKERGLVGLYAGCIASPVHDLAGNVVAIHYRLKDGTWRYFPHGAKVHPLVIGELVPGDPVDVFESTWDGFGLMEKSGSRDGIIISRGASNAKLAAALIPKGSVARLWTQNDAPSAEWENVFCANAANTCKRVKIPEQYKDLNEWIQAGACTNDLIEAIARGETLRNVERTWVETISESVVTTNELSKLEIAPRQRLLGDGFARMIRGLFLGRGE